MIKFLTTSLLLVTLASVEAAVTPRILVPVPTFGTNGDGVFNAGATNYLTPDGLQRGMAYNPTTGHLILVNRSPIESPTILILDAQTGIELGELDQSSITIGGSSSFPYNMVAVADDGAIYVGNLTTSSDLVQFNLYRWADESSPQTLVYVVGNPGTGSPAAFRWGDTLAARGSGVNTEVLVASRSNSSDSGTEAALLRPTDASMATFTSTPLTNGPANAFGYGLCFGPGNTFYTKAAASQGMPLYQLAYDPTTGALTVSNLFGTDVFPGRVGAIAYEPGSNVLAAVEMTAGTEPDLLRLYDVSDQAAAPVFLDRRALAVWTNANTLFSGQASISGTNVWALNAWNGIAAFTITNDSSTYSPYVFTQPAGQVVQLTSNAVMSVGVDGTAPLSYQWYFNGNLIPGATTNQLVITNSVRGNQGNYTVVVTNDYGSVTSSIATLTVLEGFGNLLVYEPFNYPADQTIIGQGGWNLGSSSTTGYFTNEAGNLTVPYLATSIGNNVVMNQNGSPRRPIGTYTNGVLYYSFLFRVENITSTSSETTVTFANGSSTSYTCKFNIAGTDASLTSYTVGIYKGSGTSGNGGIATNSDGTPMTFTTSDTLFIVGRYQFNPASADDSMDLWVNPDPSTFGNALPPPATIGDVGPGSGKADTSKIDNVVLRYSSGYNRRHVDELRVGFAWADVTPPSPPQLDVANVGSNVKLRWPTNISTGFTLYSTPSLNSPDWEPVPTTVVVEGVSNTVTMPAIGRQFFRLQK